MGRLTHRKENGEAAVWLYADPEKPAEVCREQLRKEKAVLEKLAYYEDLQEAGRLVVLPSDVTGKQLSKIVNACPDILGLKNKCGTHGCELCWEMALRDGGRDE